MYISLWIILASFALVNLLEQQLAPDKARCAAPYLLS